jgi:DNA-binding ferritin-like protein
MYATPLDHVFDSNQLTAASVLQEMVPELVSLALNAKQVHWNVTGPAFLPIHELTDDIDQRPLEPVRT